MAFSLQLVPSQRRYHLDNGYPSMTDAPFDLLIDIVWDRTQHANLLWWKQTE
jgi:hypothetical protein